MQEIKTVGVAGAGTMGAGIAIVCARAGLRTRVFDLNQTALDRARAQTESFLRKSVERGKLAADMLPQIMQQWHGSTDLAQFADCDLVIEAVTVGEADDRHRSARQEDWTGLSPLCRQQDVRSLTA